MSCVSLLEAERDKCAKIIFKALSVLFLLWLSQNGT
jgi:hypothetical protein